MELFISWEFWLCWIHLLWNLNTLSPTGCKRYGGFDSWGHQFFQVFHGLQGHTPSNRWRACRWIWALQRDRSHPYGELLFQCTEDFLPVPGNGSWQICLSPEMAWNRITYCIGRQVCMLWPRLPFWFQKHWLPARQLYVMDLNTSFYWMCWIAHVRLYNFNKASLTSQVHAENGDGILRAQQKTIAEGIIGPEGHYISRPDFLEANS